MKQKSIFTILVLLHVLLIIFCTGCGNAQSSVESPSAVAEKAAIVTEEIAAPSEEAEDVVGIFEGLEDNHTAIFSFDGAETVFYFEDPAVKAVLYEAALGSPYTLSWNFDESLGLDVIFEISE